MIVGQNPSIAVDPTHITSQPLLMFRQMSRTFTIIDNNDVYLKGYPTDVKWCMYGVPHTCIEYIGISRNDDIYTDIFCVYVHMYTDRELHEKTVVANWTLKKKKRMWLPIEH